MITVDGKIITKATRTCWHPDDDHRARNSVVVGRAVVQLEGRDEIAAFVLASIDRHNLGQKYVAFFEPWSSRLVLVELP